MKVLILAGGMPSTITDSDEKIPKPMAEIGGRPILWHIMKQYSYFGFNEFIICAGYKSQLIKEYFRDYYIYQSDIAVDLQKNEVSILRKQTEDWKVTIIDTGVYASIAERVDRAKEYMGSEAFLLTYGDCVSNIDISQLVQNHKNEGKLVTVALTKSVGRNEILAVSGEKGITFDYALRKQNNAWVNSCNIVMEPKALENIDLKANFLEEGLLLKMANSNQLNAYIHNGFWSPIETKRDKSRLEQMWESGKAPWKVWEE